jgi:superfamily II DNA/RNA helicase
VPTSSVVINYDLPANFQDYTHRTSCDARQLECKGITVNLVAAADEPVLHDIKFHYKTKMEQTTIPLLVQHQLSAV